MNSARCPQLWMGSPYVEEGRTTGTSKPFMADGMSRNHTTGCTHFIAGSSSWKMEERVLTFSALAFLCRMMRQPKKYWEPMTTMTRPQAEDTKSRLGTAGVSQE